MPIDDKELSEARERIFKKFSLSKGSNSLEKKHEDYFRGPLPKVRRYSEESVGKSYEEEVKKMSGRELAGNSKDTMAIWVRAGWVSSGWLLEKLIEAGYEKKSAIKLV